MFFTYLNQISKHIIAIKGGKLMQYRLYQTPNGERFWLPILAGAAIISAPLWLNNKCCNNQQPQYYQPIYQYPYQ